MKLFQYEHRTTRQWYKAPQMGDSATIIHALMKAFPDSALIHKFMQYYI